MTIGICHGSHLGEVKDGFLHPGGIGRVKVPMGCAIIFHSRLFHYGDKSRLVFGMGCSKTYRAFSYVVEQIYSVDVLETYPSKTNHFCQKKDCAECKTMKKTLNLLQS